MPLPSNLLKLPAVSLKQKQVLLLILLIIAGFYLVASKASEKGLELAYFMYPDTYEVISGDVTRLRQILVNLFSNAIKFTNSGEVILSVTSQIKYQSEPILVSQPHSQLYEITFSVKDTGIGIPEDKMHRLFKPFSQVDASTTRHYGGTGLGLVISKRLTELMGGTMCVESIVGQGSNFVFTIVAAFIEQSDHQYQVYHQQLISNKRILIVEDSVTNIQVLTSQLQSLNMVVRSAESVQKALKYLQQEQFDVAILDMQMPEMNGLTLVEKIRQLPNCQQLPLIMLTSIGNGQSNLNRDNVNIEFTAYLTKPIKKINLFNVLVSIFNNNSVMPQENIDRTSQSKFDSQMAQRIPLKILIAEDNVVNQKVAINILQRLGYRADVAANGLEVLAALRRQSYDVVLMDLQMPEMDGLTATRQICQEWPLSERPWIIAMTANAMQGDREKCLEAGMNDYTTKPIRINELTQALSNCQKQDAATTTNKTIEPMSNNVLDTKALEELKDIVCSNDLEEFIQLIECYLEDTPERFQAINDAISQKNAKKLQLEAHTLKSSSAIVGAKNLSLICKKLEDLGRNENISDAPLLLSQAMTEYQQVDAALKLECQA
jgi:CheY-like chemotaxis protein/HPt (histidine-containing phosphotransfer) domain-containing protein